MTANHPKKQIALTFDDGPNGVYTADLLEFLAQAHIPATFFQVGHCVARYPELTRQAYEAGHTIGNHSLSHAPAPYFSSEAVLHEIHGAQQHIQQAIGKLPALFRAPWFLHTPQLRRAVKQLNMSLVGGALPYYRETLQPRAEYIARHALSQAAPGRVLIFHDGYKARGGNRSQTIAAVQQVVRALTAQGYTFVTVDTLLGLPAYLPPAYEPHQEPIIL